MTLTVGSLFSGIGGLDLGLEQAGMKTVWQVEYDDWARGKLDENFPHTEKFKDVRDVGKHNLRAVDLICGGFPCVDISVSKFERKGLDGEGSGLWSEMHRILCELRPRYALIENVTNLLILDGHRVMSDLAGSGFDAEWRVIPASAFGLPIRRRRLFIFAQPQSNRLEMFGQPERESDCIRAAGKVFRGSVSLHIDSIRRSYPELPESIRMGNGVPKRVPELKEMSKGYGNAVAPPVAKWIGERIIEFDKRGPVT